MIELLLLLGLIFVAIQNHEHNHDERYERKSEVKQEEPATKREKFFMGLFVVAMIVLTIFSCRAIERRYYRCYSPFATEASCSLEFGQKFEADLEKQFSEIKGKE